MIVDFEQVLKITTANASVIASTEIALGPIAGGTTRPTLYDPNWGYFLFGQSLSTEYNDQDTYFDVATFTISGVFTINAENAVAGNKAATDDATFTRVTAKYTALESMIETAAKQTAPAAFEQWGTATDPRTVVLPYPLVDKSGNRIRALPLSFDVEPGQWGKYLRYKATLREAKFAPCKVVVNDRVVDDGSIVITLPAPILSRTPMAGCVGEVIQCRNYTSGLLEVSGTVSGPPPAGNRTITDEAHDLMTSLIADKVNVGVARLVGSALVKDVLWQNAATDEGSGIEVSHKDQACAINIRARPVKV